MFLPRMTVLQMGTIRDRCGEVLIAVSGHRAAYRPVF